MVKQNKGFTLIELLIIIGIIGFLAAAILVAVDPVRRIQEARDSKRWAEVNAILNAILTKQVDERAYYQGYSTAPILDGLVCTGRAEGPCDDLAPDCTWTPEVPFEAGFCDGVPPACAGYGTQGPCEQIEADLVCTWGDAPGDPVENVCYGVAGCSSYGNQTDCDQVETDLACNWTPEVPFEAGFCDGTGAPGGFAQIIVSADTNVDCGAGNANTPTCGALGNTLSFVGKECVANLSSLAPTYIAAIPVDPHGAGWDPDTTTATQSVISTQNTGYYLIRTPSTVGSPGAQSDTYAYTVGACWPEQVTEIQVLR